MAGLRLLQIVLLVVIYALMEEAYIAGDQFTDHYELYYISKQN